MGNITSLSRARRARRSGSVGAGGQEGPCPAGTRASDSLAPDSPAPGAPERSALAERWFRRGLEAEAADPAAAIHAYEQALARDSEHSRAHANLGRLRHEAGAFTEAEAHYRRAIFLDPEEPVYWFNLGVVLEDGGSRDQAAEAYVRCLELDASFADAHFNLAGVLERLGDPSGALRHLAAYRHLSSRR